MRCLVADGSAVVRRIVRNVLTDLGADEVVEHSDGREALEAEGPFDLLVAARALPGLDGIELARRMREKPEAAGLPVLIVAARGTRSDVTLARDAGVTGYLVKPLTAEALRERLGALLPGEAPDLDSGRGAEGDESEDQARAA